MLENMKVIMKIEEVNVCCRCSNAVSLINPKSNFIHS